jgi:hypothetical protein
MMGRRKMTKELLFNGYLTGMGLVMLLGVLAGSAGADETVILTPNKDNYINRCSVSGSETNYGGAEKLLVRSFDGVGCSLEEPKSARTIIQFDLPDLGYPVAQATLGLYYYGKLGNIDPVGRTYEIRRLLNDWTEGTGINPISAGGTALGSSWQNRHNFDVNMKFSWDSYSLPHIEDVPPCTQGCSGYEHLGGGDFPYADCNGTDHWGGDEVWATAVVPTDFGWMEWDVTTLVQGWYSGIFSNNGLLIRDIEEQWHCPCLYPDDNKFGIWFYSKEYADADYRPYLQIVYVPDATPDTCEKVWKYGLGIGSDLSRDCHVDFLDFTIFAENWLRCNDPNDPNCESTW